MNGFKTYIALGLAVAVAVIEGLIGVDVPGVDFSGNYGEIVLAAFAAFGLRSAIAKLGQ